MGAQHIAYKFVGLPTGGTVADRDQLHVVGADHVQQGCLGFLQTPAWLVGVDRPVVQNLAIGVDHSHLDPGTQPRIQAYGCPGAGGRRQQQVFQVVGEYLNSFLLRPFSELAQQVSLQAGEQFDAPGPAHRLPQPLVGRPLSVLDMPMPSHHRFAGMCVGGLFLGVQQQAEGQHSLIAAAEHCQRPV